ncbi:hypothetical protein PR003_g16134 [Phytophthora rubi]|uniref:Uncharacterized protein n=1 Tax=Phytophthora rubi TaxID=129364 RepID=A0A6A3HM45_9STRA|nr:hypothetical protein PR001_g27238 [Phytophthora rubi]KAE8970387.1 hypothetical protein PR002_g27132 [Phytophthora rubi]KAE9326951.1 hypothetical protein PR003_g16134 [Phytophthora rubi]
MEAVLGHSSPAIPNTLSGRAVCLASLLRSKQHYLRGVTYQLLLFAFPKSGTNALAFVLPSVAVTAMLCAIGGAALHAIYYVQKTSSWSPSISVLCRRQDGDAGRPRARPVNPRPT